MKRINITPNVNSLIGLSHTAHTPCSALADIIDNSIDAQASEVCLDILTSKSVESHIIIADNGTGMDETTLGKCFSLGTHEDKESSLGRFGMGQKTSCMTLGEEYIVLTRTVGGLLIKGTFNPSKIMESGEWVTEVGETNELIDIEFFEKWVKSPSGTVILIKNLRSVTKKESTKFTKFLGETFRNFLKWAPAATDIESVVEDSSLSKLKITVNNAMVYAYDPLERQWDSTKVDICETVETPNGSFKVTVVVLDLEDVRYKKRPNHKDQGVYVVRENRQIMAHDNDVFEEIIGARHSSTNMLRTEICYSKNMDGSFKVNHEKNKITGVDGKVMELLEKLIKNRYAQLRKERAAEYAKNKQKSPEISDIHNKVVDLLESKKNVLNLPNQTKIARKKGGKTGTVHPRNTPIHRTGDKVIDTKVGKFSFELADLKSTGAVFEFEFEANSLKVIWNTSHPFVQKYLNVVGETEGGTDSQIKCLDLMAMAITSYWSTVCQEDDNDEIWNKRDKFITIISDNLNQLSI
jgi:hypothetical protein